MFIQMKNLLARSAVENKGQETLNDTPRIAVSQQQNRAGLGILPPMAHSTPARTFSQRLRESMTWGRKKKSRAFSRTFYLEY